MRVLSLMMVLVLLLGFAACTKNPNTPGESDNTTAPAETTVPAETEIPDDLPEKDYGGESVNIWISSYPTSYVALEDANDIVSEALHNRNMEVSDRFEVDLIWDYKTEGSNSAPEAMQAILAGDCYDILENGVTAAASLALGGALINLNDTEYLNFDKPWWQEYVMDNIRINDRLYMVSGWFNFASVKRTMVIYFNTEMAENFGVGDLYQMVLDGEWTYDKMMEIGESVGSDVNNDGVYDDNDRYGMAGRQDWWFPQVYTSGYRFFTQNEDGTMSVTGMDDRLINVFETVHKIFDSNWYQSFYTYGQPSRPESDIHDAFADDRILFTLLALSTAEKPTMRDHGKYGILPTPKFTEDQEYGAAVLPFCSGIAQTTSDFERTTIILEALNAETYKDVRPAYFDVALSYKYVNDPESRMMLDIALANLYCDFGYVYMDSGLGRQLPMTLTQASDLASWMATYEPGVNRMLKNLVDQMMALPDEQPS